MSHSSNSPENRNERSVSDPSYFQKPNLLHFLIFSLRSGRYLLPYVFDMKCNAFPQLTFQCWNLCYIKLRNRKARLRIPSNFGQEREREREREREKSCGTKVWNRRTHVKIYRTIVKANNARKGHMRHSTKHCNRYAAIIFGIGITLLLITTNEEKSLILNTVIFNSITF
jgi:hypothetical protein